MAMMPLPILVGASFTVALESIKAQLQTYSKRQNSSLSKEMSNPRNMLWKLLRSFSRSIPNQNEVG
jgi:hypothetical protein